MVYLYGSCNVVGAGSDSVCLAEGVLPDSKVHGTNMGSTWVLSAPDGPHVGPMNLAIRALVVQWVGVLDG